MRILPGTLARDPIVEEEDPEEEIPEEVPPEEQPPAEEPTESFPKPLFGGRFSPWAIPAEFIATHPQNTKFKNELFALCPGRFNLNHERFSPVIYDVAEANTTAIIEGRPNLVNSNIGAGTRIPWNNARFICPQNFDPNDQDSYVLLVDFQTGSCIELFQTRFVPPNRVQTSVALRIKSGVNNSGSGDGNVLFKENGFRVSRASGIQHVVGLVTRKEINQGVIPHVMTAIWRRPTQFAHEPPAIKGAGGGGGVAGRAFMGMRIVWDGLTDADINSWLATRPASTRPVLRIIAECIRTYGFMGTDGGGSADELRRGATQLEHTLSAKWSDFGMTHSNSLFALHTLLEPNLAKARVLAVATHAGDGSDNNVACYPDVPYPAGHPCFGF